MAISWHQIEAGGSYDGDGDFLYSKLLWLIKLYSFYKLHVGIDQVELLRFKSLVNAVLVIWADYINLILKKSNYC